MTPPISPPAEPSLPEHLPTYLREALERQGNDRLRIIHAWIEEIIEHREQSPTDDELSASAMVSGNGTAVVDTLTDEEIESVDLADFTGTFAWEFGECGQNKCRCHSGREADLHGPYLYRYHRTEGRLRDEYIRKNDARYQTYVPRAIPRPETPAEAQAVRDRND
jgi:hypothetical protein